MGLDQSWYVEPDKEQRTESLLKGERTEDREIAYYRKWHALDEFLGNFYPPEISDYNCEKLSMTDEILDAMYDWSVTNDPSDENQLRRKVIPNIRRYTDRDIHVYYLPWW